VPAYYEIKFLPDGRVEEFAGSRGNYYEFDDGSRLDVEAVPAWCRRCGDIAHGERVEPLEKIDRHLAELQDPGSEFCRMAIGAMTDPEELRLHLIDKWQKRRRWRAGRKSPARCILCGSTDLVIFPLDEPVPHPGGDGTIEVSCVGMCSTEFNDWFFTPEGERIPRDTKPKYWHHPALGELNTSRGFRKWLKRRGGLGRARNE
jgi:hypothetical protein